MIKVETVDGAAFQEQPSFSFVAAFESNDVSKSDQKVSEDG